MKPHKNPNTRHSSFFEAFQNKFSIIQKEEEEQAGVRRGGGRSCKSRCHFCLINNSFRTKEQNIWKKSPAKFNLGELRKELLTLSPFAGNKVKRNFPCYIFHRLPLLCLYACFPPLCILENNLNLFNGICRRMQNSPCTHFVAVSLVCSPQDFL